MKRFIYIALLLLTVFGTTLTVQAYDVPSGTTTPSSGGSGSGGSGGGGGSAPPHTSGSSGNATGTVDPDTGDVDIDIDFPFNVYTPKVTYLKSVNAALANYDGAPVYFMPQLADFPTDLTTTVSDLTDGNGQQHKFAAVYGGYFDNDVVYVRAEPSTGTNSRIQTSKKVYSSEDNSRLLTLLGYDLLLQQERFDIEVSNGLISMQYNPTRLTGGDLRADTCIMDLYKAMGIYEWDIQFAYGVDKTLDIEESPFLQMFPNLTSGQKNDGFDTSESIVWVAATRTNPEQYWNRCLQDAIFDGGLHRITAKSSSYIGSETSVAFSLNSSDNVTLGEFCALARAIMTLYGEPVMTEAEQEACLLAYGVTIPQGSYTEEVRNSIIYLSAKGILDPCGKNFNQNVTFSDIEDILLRIADEGSRLTVKTNNISELASKGFSKLTNVTLASNDSSLRIIDTEDLQYRDFLVELTDATKYYMTRSTAGTGITSSGSTVKYQPTIQTSSQWESIRAQSSENIALEYVNPSTGVVTKKLPEEGYWRNVGIEEYVIDGVQHSFYHFKINPNAFSSAHFVDTEGDGMSGGTTFTLPNMDGGVYLYDNGFTYKTFGELGFDDSYRDVSTTSFVEAGSVFLSAKTQMASFYCSSTAIDDAYNYCSADTTYNWAEFFKEKKLKTGEKITIADSLQVTAFAPTSNGNADMYRIELYGTNIQRALSSVFIRKLLANGAKSDESGVGFYRAEDNTLLISTDYLSREGKIGAFEEVQTGIYCMNVKDVLGKKGIQTNVVLYDDPNGNASFIMVGETLFPKIKETLVERVGSDTYINAKALTGWAADVILVPTTNPNEAIALDADAYKAKVTSTDGVTATGIDSMVYTLNTTSSAKLAVLNSLTHGYGKNRTDFAGKGFMLTSAYSLSNYIMVCGDDQTHHLFVYHIKGLGASSDFEDDSRARELFADLTGFNLDVEEDYFLVEYSLDTEKYSQGLESSSRSTLYTNPGEQHLFYNQTTIRGQTFNGEQKVSFGWTYSPCKTDDIVESMEAWAKCTGEDYILPFASLNGKVYNVNINVCKESPTASEYEKIGTLPAYMFGNIGKKVGTITAAGYNGIKVNYTNPPAGKNFTDYKITAAPVGSFAIFKAGADATIGDLKGGTLFWGTTPLTFNPSGSKVTVGSAPVKFDGDTDITRVYYGTTLNSTYVVKTTSANVTKLVDSVNDVFSSVLDRDALSLVDWDKYTFSRLINNLDSWSSIVLIFILNILPRVCILLFFCLMLLALIKDVRPWKVFCNRVFDVYKFLTFGHVSVESIDLKRTLFTSIICLALFYIIMDGALFNFILWICEWVMALMQR